MFIYYHEALPAAPAASAASSASVTLVSAAFAAVTACCAEVLPFSRTLGPPSHSSSWPEAQRSSRNKNPSLENNRVADSDSQKRVREDVVIFFPWLSVLASNGSTSYNR